MMIGLLLLLLLLVMPFVAGLVMLLLLGDNRNRIVVFPAANFVVRSHTLQAGSVR